MEAGLPVVRYQILARFHDGVVDWSFSVETRDGAVHQFPIRDGEEVPVLNELCRKDTSVYFDPQTATLRTGWNYLGT
jgi:hypothetical protein